MIVFIGSNPSLKSEDYSAFHKDTRSGKILNRWIDSISLKDIDDICFLNIADTKTENNKPLTVSEIKLNLPCLLNKIGDCSNKKLIALGTNASKAMSLLNLDHFSAPHPSGLNRKLNDQTYVAGMLQDMLRWILDRSQKTQEQQIHQ